MKLQSIKCGRVCLENIIDTELISGLCMGIRTLPRVVRDEVPFGHVEMRQGEMCLFENEVASCFAMFIDM